MTTGRPIIAITMGDAAGIGPEVIAKALSSGLLYRQCRPLIIGERVTLQKALDLIKSPARLRVVKTASEAERLMAVVVLPTPPFWLAMQITLAMGPGVT